MRSAQVKALYARQLQETITVRRYTGTGTNRPHFDVKVRGKARLYAGTELIGPITQGDWNVLVLYDDLIDKKFAVPLTTNDKFVVAGKEIGIVAANTRKSNEGPIIVYDCQAR